MSEREHESDDGPRLPFDPLTILSELEQLEALAEDVESRLGPDVTTWPVSDMARHSRAMARITAMNAANAQRAYELGWYADGPLDGSA